MSEDLQENQLWVVEYRHKHGTDINVCKDEESAWRCACALVLDSLGELDDDEKEEEVLEQIENLYMRDAIRLYTEAKEDESFEIFQATLLSPTEGQLKEVAKQWRTAHEELKNEPQAP